jgi:hypothetical protein
MVLKSSITRIFVLAGNIATSRLYNPFCTPLIGTKIQNIEDNRAPRLGMRVMALAKKN